MTKTAELLKWSPTRSLEETLRETITYYYEQYGRRDISMAAEGIPHQFYEPEKGYGSPYLTPIGP
jgi:hypothetical protein